MTSASLPVAATLPTAGARIPRLEPVLVVAALATLALLAPLPLYVVALALFGLPHVVWELQWIRHSHARALPRRVWAGMLLVLALQALARLGYWSGALAPSLAAAIDVLTLALLVAMAFAVVVRNPSPRARLVALLAAALGGGLLLAVAQGDIVGVLVLLAVAHNAMPALLVRRETSLGGMRARSLLAMLFLLPLLLLVLALALPGLGFPLPAVSGVLPYPGEASWLMRELGAGAGLLLPALVLAQCLHYYCVLRLLPATLPAGTLAGAWRWVAVGVTLLLALYFLVDFGMARALYAVAAGVHAWIEWPLALLLLGLPAQPGRAAT